MATELHHLFNNFRLLSTQTGTRWRNKSIQVEVVKPTLQIEEQLELHEKGWVVQRVGWIVLLAIMAAGALGLFGEGVLSQQQPANGPVSVEYERFFRYETEMELRIKSSEHISTLAFPQDYIKEFRRLRIEPEPENNTTADGQIVYHFLPGNNRVLTLYMIPKNSGSISGTMQVNGTYNFNLHHFIYP